MHSHTTISKDTDRPLFFDLDEFEHLHASWLVSIGKIPYVDFFEHHNPLMWYITSPLFYIYENNVNIYYLLMSQDAWRAVDYRKSAGDPYITCIRAYQPSIYIIVVDNSSESYSIRGICNNT